MWKTRWLRLIRILVRSLPVANSQERWCGGQVQCPPLRLQPKQRLNPGLIYILVRSLLVAKLQERRCGGQVQWQTPRLEPKQQPNVEDTVARTDLPPGAEFASGKLPGVVANPSGKPSSWGQNAYVSYAKVHMTGHSGKLERFDPV